MDSGILTLRTWWNVETYTDVTDVIQDGRDIVTMGSGGEVRVKGDTFGTWSFIRQDGDNVTQKGGVGYAHCGDK